MCLSRALRMTGKQSVPQMPDLAESGWPGNNRSGGGGGETSGWDAIGLPDAQIGVFELAVSDCGSSICANSDG